MKTSAILLFGILAGTGAMAQSGGVIVTSAPTLESGQADLSAKLTQLLNEAQLQNEKLQTSLDRLGDPKAINAGAVSVIKQDIAASAATLKTREEQLTMMKGITGAEVFNDTGFGVMAPIGDTITDKDGNVKQRDPEKYKMDAAQLAHVKEYGRVREAIDERKEKIREELALTIEDLDKATDLSTILKLQTMVTALEGRLAECNATIAIAESDAAMAQKELEGQARVIVKGKQEESYLKGPRAPGSTTPAGVGGFPTPSAGGSSFKLPWGRKGSTGNPGSGSSGGGTSTPDGTGDPVEEP
ncbi:MAG TPA: hypothetical protein VGE29_11570 [Prosthecobacter sp.]